VRGRAYGWAAVTRTSSAVDRPEAAMTTWEYATVPLLPHNTKQILDNWGDDGWELVAVHTAEVGGTVAFFKRPKAQV
jgi:hypothetical protein